MHESVRSLTPRGSFDPGDRLVDRLLGADAVGPTRWIAFAQTAHPGPASRPMRPVTVSNGRELSCITEAMWCGSLGSSQNG